MRAGKAIRDERALAAAAEKLCECGHRLGGHRELPYSTFAVDFGSNPPRVVETKNLDYRPLEFHCGVDGCECVRTEAAS